MIHRNVSLKEYNSFRLDYKADHFISLRSEDDFSGFQRDRHLLKPPLFVLGGGSNVLFTGDFKGTVIHPAVEGISIEDRNSEFVVISVWAGTNWDRVVEWSVENGLCGFENLSLIPGSAGATPVQNIGAYGVEIKDVVVRVDAINLADGSEMVFTNEECRFGYRDSLFKREGKGNYLIKKVFYRLNIRHLYNLSYGSLEKEVKERGKISLQNIRQTVISIRQSKLPDPKLIGNAGSFFKNPVIDEGKANDLKDKYNGIPLYKEPSGMLKVAAGWLIEQCGWKGKRSGDAGVHEKQALVLVNYGKANGKQIYELSEDIRKSVLNKFGIGLEREAEVIGPI